MFVTCLGLFMPLLGFTFLMLLSAVLSKKLIQGIACATIFISFVSFSYIGYEMCCVRFLPQELHLFSWIPIEGINAQCALHLDHLSLLMTLLITGLAFLIHIYSCGYMEHEKDIARYFAVLNFFVFSMLLLVLAADLIVLFVGWEGVGLASYLLIGFWYERPQAAGAAKKAFIVNRVGDLGLLLAILMTLNGLGSAHIATVCQKAPVLFAIGAPAITVLTLLFFIGASGKSAQIPLHVWLPDAMEGPTPVSALIHAATMVNAGVYLIVRLHPLFTLAPATLEWIGYIGCVTSLGAALCAISQTDLKRILAYSTLSQLGLMFLACGSGAFYAAMFHMTTHAFVKALLFLSAGNVVHMMHGITDVRKMGGLFQELSKTHIFFLIGILSLSGVPPLANFLSKDLILEEGYHSNLKILSEIGMVITFLTGFYLTRAYILTFRGARASRHKEMGTIQEAPYIMLAPLFVLGSLACLGGFLGFSWQSTPPLMQFLASEGIQLHSVEANPSFHFSYEMGISICAAFLSISLAGVIYGNRGEGIGKVWKMLHGSFYIDQIYHALIVQPINKIARFTAIQLEIGVFERLIRLTADGSLNCATFLQKMQNGLVRSYASWMIWGASCLLLYLLL